MYYRESIEINTAGRGTYEVTDQIMRIVSASGVEVGLCHIFIHHTSASLILCENADPVVRQDLERFMAATVPDGASMFRHTAEGADDMPAHVRSILTQSDVTLPVANRRCALGTWQGIYLWEHRTSSHRRKLSVTVSGEQ